MVGMWRASRLRYAVVVFYLSYPQIVHRVEFPPMTGRLVLNSFGQEFFACISIIKNQISAIFAPAGRTYGNFRDVWIDIEILGHQIVMIPRNNSQFIHKLAQRKGGSLIAH